MTQKAQRPADVTSAGEKTRFTEEELLALSETLRKSRAKTSETKAQTCAYHR